MKKRSNNARKQKRLQGLVGPAAVPLLPRPAFLEANNASDVEASPASGSDLAHMLVTPIPPSAAPWMSIPKKPRYSCLLGVSESMVAVGPLQLQAAPAHESDESCRPDGQQAFGNAELRHSPPHVPAPPAPESSPTYPPTLPAATPTAWQPAHACQEMAEHVEQQGKACV